MLPYVVIFMLFFAVLAFAWFYLQRAKGRDATTATPPETASDAAPAGDPAP